VDLRITPDMPEALVANPQARAYFGAILMALGDEAVAELDAAARRGHADNALAITRVVQDAIAEHSLDPQGIEAAIRKDLLKRFYASLGLNKANAVIGHVLRITRVTLSRRN
jgi:type I restriction enzyme R subunit